MADLALKERLLQLSIEDRLELIAELWDSLADTREATPASLTAEQRDELTRRLEELDSHPERAIDWAVARERLRSRSRE
jgi:putative addiction module component (TIGR02574 family)